MSNPYRVIQFDNETRRFSPKLKTLPPAIPGQIKIRMRCCTLCGSDLHTYTGRRSSHPNSVLGHEIVGTIESWDGDAAPLDYHGQPLNVGQRVTWSMVVACGDCFYCKQHLPQKCDRLFKYGHASGDDLACYGGLAEFLFLKPGTSIFPVPDELPDCVAAPANCATATVSAAIRLATETHSLKGAHVAVIGSGMLGLTAAAQLSLQQASTITMIDRDPNRLALSSSFGATHQLNLDGPQSSTSIDLLLNDLTDGRGMDIVFEFAGPTSAVSLGLDLVRTGGCLILAGSVFPDSPIEIPPEQIVRKMLTLRGLHNYRTDDLARAIEFLAESHTRFPLGELVTRQFSLSQTQTAFELANRERPIRVAVIPDSPAAD